MEKRITLFVLTTIFSIISLCQTHADDKQTPHSIIDRALKAIGGADKISQYKAISVKAIATVVDVDEIIKLSGLFAGHSLFRIELENTNKDTGIIVSGGDTLWIKQGQEPFKELSTAKAESKGYNFFSLIYGIKPAQPTPCIEE